MNFASLSYFDLQLSFVTVIFMLLGGPHTSTIANNNVKRAYRPTRQLPALKPPICLTEHQDLHVTAIEKLRNLQDQTLPHLDQAWNSCRPHWLLLQPVPSIVNSFTDNTNPSFNIALIVLFYRLNDARERCTRIAGPLAWSKDNMFEPTSSI